jgi:hypothetical protein
MQCFISVMFIQNPVSRFFFIPDFESRNPNPGCNNNKRGEENFVFTIFLGTNFTKIENYFIFEQVPYPVQKTFEPNPKNYCTFYQKYCHEVLRNMGVGIRYPDPGMIPNPGV